VLQAGLAGRGPALAGMTGDPGADSELSAPLGRSGGQDADSELSAPPRWSALVAAHRRPQPDYAAGPLAAAAGATSMIDVSDGLLADLGHIADASGVAMDVRSASLPGAAELEAAAAELGADWRDWALAGGEDHVLAASFPAVTAVPRTWTVVGDVRPGAGVLVDSRPWSGARGWDHFGKAGR
jgi:thiamine-monophosphate kinase